MSGFPRHFVLSQGALWLFLLFIPALTSAQVTTGNLQGVVVDPNRAAVAGATVKITNEETGQTREVQTNSEGFYRVTNLVPGNRYRVEVTAQGFAPRTVENVPIRLGTENNLDIQLEPSGVGATVEVTAASGLIDATQSQLSQNFTPQQVTQLPLVGGAIDNLALLTPGVATPGDADFTNGVGISANGNRGRSNNFQIDGQDNNDNSVAGPSLTLTNTEAIGEYQVITNSFSAEFGRNAGAQINVITKPGTNEFHGSLFEYLENSALNARSNTDKRTQANYQFLANNGFSAFSGLANRNKDPFTYNRFGGAIGGPLKKDKAFFFVTYQGDYQRGEAAVDNLGSGAVTFTRESAALAAQLFPNAATQALTSTAIGGGPAFVQGVGQFLIAPPVVDTNGDGVADTFAYGPGNPFGNPVTPNRLSPSLYVRNATGQLIPLYTGEAARIIRNDFSTDQIITREDFNITKDDTLTVRYIYDNSRFPLATGRFLAGAVFDVPSTNNNLGVTYTRNISSKTVNEARFNFSRLNVKFGDPDGPRPGPGIQFAGTRDLNFNLSLTFGTQNNLPQSRVVDVYQFQDTVATTQGNHALKFGADIRHQRVNNFFLPNFLGTYVFQGSNPFGPPTAASGAVPANTFYFDDGTPRTGFAATAFENFLLGRPREIRFALGDPRILTTQNDFFFFLQDDWRVRPNLTFNLGLRYEISTTPFNPLIEKLNAREADPARAIFNTAFPLETRTLAKLPLDKNNIAPRVGFAWQPNLRVLGKRFTEGRTVIRGGFGIAYDPSFFNIVLNTVTAAPFAAAGIVRQTPGAPGSVSFPFLPNNTAALNTTPGTNGGDPRLFSQTRVDPNFYNPYTISFNFGIQQELFRNGVLEVRYAGSRIVGQFQTVNANPDVSFLNRAAQCLGLAPGAFTNGVVVGTPASSAAAACAGAGFNNRPGTSGNGRVDPNFGPVRLRNNGASATYHGLQTRFETRLTNLLTLRANYTFSKTIDNASEIFSTLAGGQTVAHSQNPFDTTRGERGLSAFHQKHVFTSDFIYELPFFRSQQGFIGRLLGGYQLSGIVRLGSGRPYTPVQVFGTYDPSWENGFIGAGGLRPYVGNPSAPASTVAFGSTAAGLLFGYSVPAGQFVVFDTSKAGSTGTVVSPSQAMQQARLIYNDFGLFTQFGVPLTSLEAFQMFKTPYSSLGRNTFTGEPVYLVNLAVIKQTRLTEQTRLEFRAEAANLLNRRNFGVPDPILEDAYTGFAVGSYQNPGFNAGGSRTLRFGLRFIF